EEPYRRVRDTIRFLRTALAGEKVSHEYDTFAVKGFRLGIRVDEIPPILVAALRPGMLRLAGRQGDGAIINWLSADDVKTVVPHLGDAKEIVARIFVLPTDDEKAVRFIGKRAIAAYLNVPVYAALHAWLGRGETLQPMWDAWKAGEREAATAAIPDELVDDLIVHGKPDQIRERLARYAANGVTTPAPAFLAGPDDTRRALREQAPSSAEGNRCRPTGASGDLLEPDLVVPHGDLVAPEEGPNDPPARVDLGSAEREVGRRRRRVMVVVQALAARQEGEPLGI